MEQGILLNKLLIKWSFEENIPFIKFVINET